ncbi:MAG: cysteine--tRNA ligase [Paracoccaceae bacterium]
MTIKLYDTKARKKRDFIPLDDKNLRMYVCGPTVYDRAHLGNARPVVVFDVLYRLLRHTYGADHVTYVRNFTDVDDKINARAAESGRSIGEITDETIQWYLDDMKDIGALEPTHMPRATAYIPQMIAMIETLINKGCAYSKPITFGHNSYAVYFNAEKAPEHVFFNVEQDESYGELSGRSLDEMISGARSEVGEGKNNPMDFVLWKPSTRDEPGWKSPWGYGRPGWHIECSAMAKSLLGDVFDIHGGGLDLQFPHHENEIAQSCCANDTKQMARYWLHNEMLQVEGKKMSKSLGNFFTVRDLLDQGVPGEVIRFVFLQTHYRKPMDWTEKKAKEARQTLVDWYVKTDGVHPNFDVVNIVVQALSDDLNTHAALNELRFFADGMSDESASYLKAGMLLLGFPPAEDVNWFRKRQSTIPGLAYSGFREPPGLDQVFALVREWAELRKEKKYAEADLLRGALALADVRVHVVAGLPMGDVGFDFDPAKLEALL